MAEEFNIESNENLSSSPELIPESNIGNNTIINPSIDNSLNNISGPGTGVVNYEHDFTDLSIIDGTTFNDSVQIALDGMPNLERNQPFFDMIDEAAVDMDKYPAMFSNNNMDSPFPGRAGTNYNPFETSTGEIDLSTENGRSNFLAASQTITSESYGPTKPQGFIEPQEFSARRYNLDRFYRHPNFAELGFHPFANNEAYYQANSTKWDNFTRTRSAFIDMFGPAFWSSYRAVGDMFTGDIRQADMLGAQSMEDAMRIGSSTSGGTRGFFNDLFLNSAYTMGIVSNILVEEAIIGGVTALTAVPSGGTSTIPAAA